jgi:hypothetical protein
MARDIGLRLQKLQDALVNVLAALSSSDHEPLTITQLRALDLGRIARLAFSVTAPAVSIETPLQEMLLERAEFMISPENAVEANHHRCNPYQSSTSLRT